MVGASQDRFDGRSESRFAKRIPVESRQLMFEVATQLGPVDDGTWLFFVVHFLRSHLRFTVYTDAGAQLTKIAQDDDDSSWEELSCDSQDARRDDTRFSEKKVLLNKTGKKNIGILRYR